jgi:hypothetical protein
MIRFEQTGSDEPLDVRVLTDDADAELARMQDAFENADAEDMLAFQNLGAAARHDDGMWSFIIPGREAGEVGEVLWHLGLADWLEQKNAEVIADMERRARETGQER